MWAGPAHVYRLKQLQVLKVHQLARCKSVCTAGELAFTTHILTQGYEEDRPRQGSERTGTASPSTCTKPVVRTTPPAIARTMKKRLCQLLPRVADSSGKLTPILQPAPVDSQGGVLSQKLHSMRTGICKAGKPAHLLMARTEKIAPMRSPSRLLVAAASVEQSRSSGGPSAMVPCLQEERSGVQRCHNEC